MIDLDRLDSWDFDLPKERIAALPPATRGDSRMLRVSRDGALEDGVFADLAQELRAGDVLVFNDTRVLQARLQARRASGGKVELLVVGRAREGVWTPGETPVLTAMLKSNRRVVEGETLTLELPAETIAETSETGEARAAQAAAATSEDASVTLRLLDRNDDGLVRFAHDGDFFALLERFGRLPLPPYIEERRVAAGEPASHPSDATRYQTVFAKDLGAVAAPTAGLHFTDAFLDAARAKGVGVEHVTLHVGIGTFRPVKTERLSEHAMHEEVCRLPEAVADRLNRARAEGGRVVAVGTTVVRTLETFAGPDGVFASGERATDIFLRPGYAFRGTDALLTNFHLPKSTLLALVAAFVGFEPMMAAYRFAIASGYRFFSYGDAMWLPGPASASVRARGSREDEA